MNHWSPLNHRLHQILKAHKMEGSRIVLAVSGGADSMGLMLFMNDMKSALNLDLRVLHVHHGPGRWQSFRDRAERIVREGAHELGIPFKVIHSEFELHSEQDLRQFRRESLLEHAEGDWIFTGHHLQDLVETRLIRLIRGTGKQGLKSIPMRRKPWFRPLLSTSVTEIRQELSRRNSPFWEDPSNRDKGPLRNWIRHEWLPSLEQKRPGAIKSLGRSLENLARKKSLDFKKVWVSPSVLSRGFFHTLDSEQKQQVLAQCLLRVVGLNYSSGQIKEIQKRLDNPKKEHTFKMKNSLWEVNAEQISVTKVHPK